MIVKDPFVQSFVITSYQVDMNKRLTVSCLLNMMQEVAWQHSTSCGAGWQDLKKENCFWALTKMHICIRRMPEWLEEVKLHTWGKPGPYVVQPRDFEMYDSAGNLLMQATSDWVILDFTTFKPQRLEHFNDKIACVADRHAIGSPAPKIPILKKSEDVQVHPVLFSDIDVNQHVNNVKYVQWTLDNLPVDYLFGHTLKELMINFVTQAKLGDSYRIVHDETAPGTIETAIRSAADGHDFCRLRTLWELKTETVKEK